jgi:acyl-CoA thioesterase
MSPPEQPDPTPAPSDLAAATAVRQLERAPGWYVAELPNDWSYITPSGGVLMTVAMRAMVAELDDEGLKPISANTHFCSPVPAGPLEIRVETLRRGNAFVQMRAALSSTSKPGPGLEVSATFGRDRKGPDVYGMERPDVPTPADATPTPDRSISSDARARARPFFCNFEVKLAEGAKIWQPGWQAGDARMAFWYRYLVPQKPGGMLDPLAIPPIADTMPGALVRKLGPDHERIYAPSLDLTVHFLDPSDGDWYLVDVRAKRARAGYATASADIWDEHGRMIAQTTQTMMLRKYTL